MIFRVKTNQIKKKNPMISSVAFVRCLFAERDHTEIESNHSKWFDDTHGKINHNVPSKSHRAHTGHEKTK